MDVSDLRRLIGGLEDGLQVVAWDEDEHSDAMPVWGAFYCDHATKKRGLVILIGSEYKGLRQKVADLDADNHALQEENDDLQDTIHELEKRIDELSKSHTPDTNSAGRL